MLDRSNSSGRWWRVMAVVGEIAGTEWATTEFEILFFSFDLQTKDRGQAHQIVLASNVPDSILLRNCKSRTSFHFVHFRLVPQLPFRRDTFAALHTDQPAHTQLHKKPLENATRRCTAIACKFIPFVFRVSFISDRLNSNRIVLVELGTAF